jgi:hypothetical protein
LCCGPCPNADKAQGLPITITVMRVAPMIVIVAMVAIAVMAAVIAIRVIAAAIISTAIGAPNMPAVDASNAPSR